MVKELYIREPNDPKYIKGIIEHSDVREMIISKIMMILGTRPNTILGGLDFGIGISDLVFTTNISNRSIEDKLSNHIRTYIPESSNYTITPKVQFGNGEGYDYCIIDIFIDNERVIGIQVY